MEEVWLRGNTRLLWLAIVAAGCLVLAGCALVLGGILQHQRNMLLGGVIVNLLAVGVLVAVWRQNSARITSGSGYLIINVGAARPSRIPIEVVECFLLGRGPAFLPGAKHRRTETTTLVIRLRDKDPKWEHRDLQRQFGTWCGHHVTLRGMWCEPLTIARIQELNDRLVATQRMLGSTT